MTSVENRLLDEAAEVDGTEEAVAADGRAAVMAAVSRPEWEKAWRTHDWRNHVPAVCRDLWGDMSLESRLVAFMAASEAASNEEWE